MAQIEKDILVTGYSGGAGKSFLITEKIISFAPETLISSISHTNRNPRGIEKNGKEYHFVGLRQIETLISHKFFLEYTNPDPTNGIYYGTSKEGYVKAKDQGKCVVFDVDYKGFEQLTNNPLVKNVVTVLLLTPVWQRIQWMEKRKNMTERAMLDRIKYSEKIEKPFFEKHRDNFDFVFDDYSEEKNCDLLANEIVNAACA